MLICNANKNVGAGACQGRRCNPSRGWRGGRGRTIGIENVLNAGFV